MISTAKAAEIAPVVTAEEPKATKKANVGARRAHVAPKKTKEGKKAHPAKKTARARDGSKAATILDLLKRKDGATLKELMKATGWQPHSVRGFLSGTISKRLGSVLTSSKSEDGERIYSVKG